MPILWTTSTFGAGGGGGGLLLCAHVAKSSCKGILLSCFVWGGEGVFIMPEPMGQKIGGLFLRGWGFLVLDKSRTRVDQ